MPSYKRIASTSSDPIAAGAEQMPAKMSEYRAHRTTIETKAKQDHNSAPQYRYRCLTCDKTGKYQDTPKATRRGAMAHSRVMKG